MRPQKQNKKDSLSVSLLLSAAPPARSLADDAVVFCALATDSMSTEYSLSNFSRTWSSKATRVVQGMQGSAFIAY